jgi:hypothetical protein
VHQTSDGTWSGPILWRQSASQVLHRKILRCASNSSAFVGGTSLEWVMAGPRTKAGPRCVTGMTIRLELGVIPFLTMTVLDVATSAPAALTSSSCLTEATMGRGAFGLNGTYGSRSVMLCWRLRRLISARMSGCGELIRSGGRRDASANAQLVR